MHDGGKRLAAVCLLAASNYIRLSPYISNRQGVINSLLSKFVNISVILPFNTTKYKITSVNQQFVLFE